MVNVLLLLDAYFALFVLTITGIHRLPGGVPSEPGFAFTTLVHP
jgi:hypothetical protein